MPDQAPSISDISKDPRYQALSPEGRLGVRDQLLDRLRTQETYRELSETGRVEAEARLTELLGLSKQEAWTSLTAEQAQALLKGTPTTPIPVTTRGGHATVPEQPKLDTTPFFDIPHDPMWFNVTPEQVEALAEDEELLSRLRTKVAEPADMTNVTTDLNQLTEELRAEAPEDPSDAPAGPELRLWMGKQQSQEWQAVTHRVEVLEGIAQEFYKKYMKLPEDKRVVALSKDSVLNLFGVRNWLSRVGAHPGEQWSGTPGLFDARSRAIQRAREKDLITDLGVTVLSDVPKLSAEFLLAGAGLSKALGTIPAGASWVQKAGRASATFMAHAALQAPSPEQELLSAEKFVAKKSQEIVRSGALGLALGGVSRLIPSAIMRAPVVIGALSTLAYGEVLAQGGSHEEARRAALKTGAMILAFEMQSIIPEAIRSRQTRATAEAYTGKVLEARSVEQQRANLKRYVEQVRVLAEASKRKAGTTVVEPVRTTESFVPALRAAKTPAERAEVLRQFREQVKVSKAGKEADRGLVEAHRRINLENAKKVARMFLDNQKKLESLARGEMTPESVAETNRLMQQQYDITHALALDPKVAYTDANIDQLIAEIRKVVVRPKAPTAPKPPERPAEPAPTEIPAKTEYAPKDTFVEGQFRSTQVDGVKVTFGKNATTGKREIRSVTFKPTMSQTERATWFAKHPMPGQAGEIAQGRAEATTPTAEDATRNVEQIKAKSGLWSRAKVLGARALGPLYPSKVVIEKFGPDIDAEIHYAVQDGQAAMELLWKQTRIKGTARWPARALERLTRRAALGRTIDQLQTEIDRYPRRVQKNMMMSVGDPLLEGGKDIQRAARASLTKRQLQVVDEVLQPIRDLLLAKGREMYPELRKFEAYFYGLFKNPQQKTMLLDSATNKKSTLRFMQQKGIATPADGEALGFQLIDSNPIRNLRRVGEAYYYHNAMETLQKTMYERGVGVVIRPRKGPGEPTPAEMASGQWEKIGQGQYQEPAFSKDYVQRDVAKVINNRIATNMLSASKTGRAARFGYRTAQQLKFLGSLFHRGLIFLEDVAVGRPGSFFNPMNWARAVEHQFAGIGKAQLKDPIYEKYLHVAGPQASTMEGDVVRVADNFLGSLGKGWLRPLFAPVRAGAAVARMGNPQLFKQVIPRVKFEKFKAGYMKIRGREGREPTKAEQVEIVKEIDNIFGMMNEGLYGMSGTAISIQRIIATAPGFYRGNVHTEFKGVVQFPMSLGKKGRMSALNLVQSYATLATFAAVVRTIYEGKVPELPKNMQELRDFVKLRTGEVDEDGREVMFDMIKHQRDYEHDIFRPLMILADGKIDRIPEYMVDRLLARGRSMTAPLAKVGGDAVSLWQKGAVYDWGNDKVFYPSDPLLRRFSKLLAHEWTHFEPIALSVQRRSAKVKSITAAESLLISILGLRPTLSEEELELNKLARKVWDHRDEQKQLYYDLGKADHPRRAIEQFNEKVDDLYGDERMSSEFEKKMKLDKRKLHIDVDRLLTNKVIQFTDPSTDEATQKKIRAYLNNFDAGGYSQMRKYLRLYKRAHPTMKESTFDQRMDRLRRRSRLTQ